MQVKPMHIVETLGPQMWMLEPLNGLLRGCANNGVPGQLGMHNRAVAFLRLITLDSKN